MRRREIGRAIADWMQALGRKLRDLQGCQATHDPKVVDSNPALATMNDEGKLSEPKC